MPAITTRTRTINLRIGDERRALIDRAAEATGKDRTEFMLDAATREATTVLLDSGTSSSIPRRSRNLQPPSMRRRLIIRACGSFSLGKRPGRNE